MNDRVLPWEVLRKQGLRSDEFRFVGISEVVFPVIDSDTQLKVVDPFSEFGNDPFISWSLTSQAPTRIQAEKGSRITKLTTLRRFNPSDSIAPVVDVHVEVDAALDYIVLLDSGDSLDFFPRIRVFVDQNAKANLFFVQKCSGHSQLRVEVLLKGAGAKAQIASILKGSKQGRFEHGIRVQHLAPDTTTQMDSLALLNDSAHATFRGQLEIAKAAPFSKAFEKSRALLLSSDAQFDVLPQLWIATSEVQCSHGASVSSFADDEKFYLATRGIPEHESEAILCAGLLKEGLSNISCTEHRLRAEEFLGVHSYSTEESW